MTDIINIQLNKLITWTGNVRKTRSKTAIDKLVASIKVHGGPVNYVDVMLEAETQQSSRISSQSQSELA